MKHKYSTITIYILTLILLVLSIRLVIVRVNPISAQTSTHNTRTGFALEPDTPQNISDPPFHMPQLPENEIPVSQVLENGAAIPVTRVYDNPDWERPAYKEYWHSKYGRWSYVPHRIHYAMHRIFSTYVTASIYYDFIHDLGIADESTEFRKIDYASPYEYFQIVVMNTSIEKVLTYQNQIVIVGVPKRTGLVAINIPTNVIHPSGETNYLLIQLVTPDGYEIDYTTEVLVHPD